MLPIPEMVSVARRLDDGGRWSVADQVAAAWGAGEATFVRSSACHVFRSNRDGASSPLILRLRPNDSPEVDALHRSARAAQTLHAAGAPVAQAICSLDGSLMEQRDGYAAMAVRALTGVRYADDEVDEEVAQAWGAALARVHRAGGHAMDAIDATEVQIPDIVRLCEWARASLATNVVLNNVVLDNAVPGSVRAGDIIAELQDLPLDPHVYGLLHGDPEIDNVVFTKDGPIMIDLDDVRRGWFAADIGFALRDWAEIAAAPDLAAPIPAAFVAGYRSVRQVSDEELAWLPLLARAAGLETLAELQPVLADPSDPAWPDWAHRLAKRVCERDRQLRRALTHDSDTD
jgi:Ser/Thr protein kinase RdoA (MazF antagonist)